MKILAYNSSMLLLDLIRRKRDGERHSPEEFDFIVKDYTLGKIDDAQMAAWLMAAYIRGLDLEETVGLTTAMVKSGTSIDLGSLVSRAVDKHSTGGVGDKTTLIVGPLAAAAGLKVPKLSGKSLGHTGGTLDKLAAITGLRTSLFQDEFVDQIKEIGIAIVAQTSDIAPADKKMYALRDRTATVESIPLIAASILSKKAAGGAKHILIDVKVGTGAFMRTLDGATELADTLVAVGKALNLNVRCLITDMNQPLGRAVGDALEVGEAIDTLAGGGPDDLREVSIRLVTEMLWMGRLAPNRQIARDLAVSTLDSGAGLDVFGRMIEAQKGDAAIVQDRSRLPSAAYTHNIIAERDGFFSVNDCRAIGRAVGILAGRHSGVVAPDAGVGVVMGARHGDKVEVGDGLVEVHYNHDDRRAEADQYIRGAIEIVSAKPAERPLIYETTTDE